MSAVWTCARAEWRQHLRTWAMLTLLAGLSAGLVVTLAAGARRTASAMPRLLASHGAAHFQIPNYGFLDFAATFDVERIRRLPEVEAVAAGRFGLHGRGMWFAPFDSTFGHDVNRWKVLAGRAPDPARPGEAAVTFLAAEEHGITLGEEIALPATREALAGFGIEGDPVATVRIVGIVAGPGDLPPNEEDRPSLYLTPAFARDVVPVIERRFASAQAPIVFRGKPAMYVRLREGTSTDAFRRRLDDLAGPLSVIVLGQHQQDARAARSIALQANALWMLAGVGGAAVLLILSQLLSRHTTLASTDNPVRRALGMGRRSLVALGVVRAELIALPAAAIAAAVAAGLSPLLPAGLARIAEPDPGFELNLAASGVGAFALLVLLPVLALVPVWRGATSGSRGDAPSPPARPSRLLGRVRSSLPVSASSGVGLALERGHGRSGVPVRSTIGALLLSLAAVAASTTFAHNLDRLLRTPPLYGRSFDLWLANDPEGFPARSHLGTLRADPGIDAIAIGTPGETFLLDGVETSILPFEAVTSGAAPTVLEGRAPRGPSEIALGSRALAALGKRVDPRRPDRVEISGSGKSVEAAIVGRVVVPPLTDRSGFGEGALVHPDLMNRLVPGTGDGGAFVSLRPGVDADALLARLRAATGIDTLYYARFEPPSDVANFGRIEELPAILSAAFGAIAVATLAHTVASTVRRRRRDLAILRTLGLLRRQSGVAVLIGAVTLATTALALGVPLGIAVGRWLWVWFADRLGVLTVASVPAAQIALLVPGTLLLAALVASVPARSAALMRASVALRSE